MKKTLALFLTLTVLLLVGCSGDVDTNSTDSAFTEVSSNQTTESKDEVNSSEIESTVDKEESQTKDETSSNVEQEPEKEKTYFEKYNLKLSPLNTNVCFNKEKGHTCGKHKTITIKKENLQGYEYIYDDLVLKGGVDISKYNCVHFDTYSGWFDEGYAECYFNNGAPFYIFDKYTGMILNFNCEWMLITHNGKTYKVSHIPDGEGGGETNQSVYCPKDYDGLIFVMMAEEDINRDIFNDGKTHTIDEVIDLKNDKYYLFAAN